MTPWLALGSAFWLGLMTSISPCPLATNIAAISFLGRSVGNTRKVLLSGILYTLGRTVVYVGLGVLVLYVLHAASDGGDPNSAAAGVSRFLQKYMGVILGPVLILVGMMLLGMLEIGGLIGLSTETSSPVLLPTLFGIGSAVPVIGFALLMAFASQYVGRAFNRLTQIERWVRGVVGLVFILAGIYYCLTHIYGLSPI